MLNILGVTPITARSQAFDLFGWPRINLVGRAIH